MRVFLFDEANPEVQIGGRYTIDTTLGVPAIGDDIFLKSHDYTDLRKAYLSGKVRRRCWIFSDHDPAGAILQVWVQRNGA
jgi:hypothetical protein